MLSIEKRLIRLIENCKKKPTLIARMTKTVEAEPEVINYIKNRIKNLQIEIGGCSAEDAYSLVEKDLLEGLCWQSSQSCAVFFNDDDYVERATLYLPNENNRPYFHSYICFYFKNKEYVFDPSLHCICLKEVYNRKYKPEVEGRVSAKAIKEKLIYEITHKKATEVSWLDEFLSDETKEKLNNETVIHGTEDTSAPFFRSTIGYTATIENEEITSLIAHYYYGNC